MVTKNTTELADRLFWDSACIVTIFLRKWEKTFRPMYEGVGDKQQILRESKKGEYVYAARMN